MFIYYVNSVLFLVILNFKKRFKKLIYFWGKIVIEDNELIDCCFNIVFFLIYCGVKENKCNIENISKYLFLW